MTTSYSLLSLLSEGLWAQLLAAGLFQGPQCQLSSSLAFPTPLFIQTELRRKGGLSNGVTARVTQVERTCCKHFPLIVIQMSPVKHHLLWPKATRMCLQKQPWILGVHRSEKQSSKSACLFCKIMFKNFALSAFSNISVGVTYHSHGRE